MVFLLWNDVLPTRSELAEFAAALARERTLPAVTLETVAAAAAQKVSIMDALRMATGTLTSPASGSDAWRTGITVIAKLPTIVAAMARRLAGQEPVAPRSDLGHAANYLYMLWGHEPNAEQTRALETYLNTVIDHALNASTFTARVIMSTGSDLVSAIVGAIGALKGPLHGGAPGPALDMVFEIGEADKAEAYLRAKLERKERLMGFGHRIYKTRDPRADVLAAAADSLYRQAGDMRLYALARSVEEVAVRLLEEYHPHHNLKTNVEFYTALLLHGLGLPTALFTPTFAISRAAGWVAHCQEQHLQNKLLRPQSEYIGPRGRPWIPIEQRHA
jgi:citrate synthase